MQSSSSNKHLFIPSLTHDGYVTNTLLSIRGDILCRNTTIVIMIHVDMKILSMMMMMVMIMMMIRRHSHMIATSIIIIVTNTLLSI